MYPSIKVENASSNHFACLSHLVHKVTDILEYLLVDFLVLVKPLAVKTGGLNLQTQMYMSIMKVSGVSQIII